MICARCLRRASARGLVPNLNHSPRTPPLTTRLLSSSHHAQERKPLSPNTAHTSTPQRNPPAATSTSAAQPFSAKDTPGPQTTGTPMSPSSPRQQQQKQLPKSSVPAGTPLKGLNYFKNKDDPIAMEDHEYPDWLWELLSEKKQTVEGEEAKDPRLYAKSARARRAANKRARAQAMENAGGQQQQVPIYEQSVNLSPDPAARQELTKAMREKRRKDIKTANFLKSMG